VELKHQFTTVPVLFYYHPKRKKQIEIDASDLFKVSILSQYKPDRHWNLLSYYNKPFLPAALNYNIHDKEMVVIVNCFQEWQHFLMGAPEEIVVLTDHQNLKDFHTIRLLNWRQARRVETLSQFNFKIVSRPGEKHCKADTLFHQVDLELEGQGETQDLVIRMFKLE